MQYLVTSKAGSLAPIVLVALGCSPPRAAAQPVPSQAPLTTKDFGAKPPPPLAMQRLTALRDSFVLQTKVAGFICPIGPPKIVLSDIASFGSYEPKTNVLQTPTWQQLSADEREVFFNWQVPVQIRRQRAQFSSEVHTNGYSSTRWATGGRRVPTPTKIDCTTKWNTMPIGSLPPTGAIQIQCLWLT
jgi:hypothetical protein